MPIFFIKKAFVNLYLQKNDFTDVTPSNVWPYIYDFNCGWIGTGNGLWTYEYPTKCYSDIYQIQAGHKYWLTLGDIVGTRFRVIFSSTDVSQATGSVSGLPVNTSNYNNPAPHQNLWYTPDYNGYLVIQKDNAGSSGIYTYLYDYGIPPVICYPLGCFEPDNYDHSKIMQIVLSIMPCLQDTLLLKAVKKIEGYKIIVT